MEVNNQPIGLPENAYRELNPGEVYTPIMSPDVETPELNKWTLLWGILMSIIFSGAAAYLGLKIGQVFEAAIPIAIIAVGVSTLGKRKKALGENVIIQSIGAASGLVVAGAIFTIPALYILKLEVAFFQVFLASCLGGFLGILFMIPFRRYFMSEMHGKFPFPEATAITEVLVAGEKGGNQAKVLVIAGLIGGIYDFIIASFGWWKEEISTRVFAYGEKIATDLKVVFKVNISAAVLGLGYIIGLKYSAVIAAGSFLSFFVFIPLVSYFGQYITVPIGTNVDVLISNMTAEQIFTNYVRHIGIGGIAMAGLIGIIRSSPVIKSALQLAVKELFGKKAEVTSSKRTDKDLPMSFVVVGIVVVALILFVFFAFGVVSNIFHALVGLAIVLIIAFLFTTVAATATAIVGTNPVSGMTLMTLILSSLVLVSVGLSGVAGMTAALIIGGVVCTALSTAGGFVTDLKTGYWLGSSPYKQQQSKLIGIVFASLSVAGVIYILNTAYGFVATPENPNPLQAPQANAMAAVIQPLMSNQPAPWMLYFIGAIIALLLTMLNIPALAFALGMYLPLQLNSPLLIGGLISWFVSTRSKDDELNKARREKGTLIASGFIAGGALFGVFSAVIRFIQIMMGVKPWNETEWAQSVSAEWMGVIMFGAIIAYVIWDSLKAKKDE